MATGSKTEINAMVARCRKVGWTVDRAAGGGWKVIFDDQTSYLIHSSYSDRNAPESVLRHLEKMGLSRKEKALEDKRTAAKAARLDAERKAAEAKAAKMAKANEATARAAGPYAGPEVIELDWFLKAHPAPWMRWAIITPELAREIMKRNIDNRHLSPATAAYYGSLIEHEPPLWRLTHQGVAMDTRGILQDGQHRLQACIDTGTSISVAFFVGMDPDNFKTIDEGRNRSIADLLGKDDVADRNTLGTTLRLIASYREVFPRQFLKLKTPNQVLYDSFKGDPERLAEAVRWGKQNAKQAGIVSSGLCSATYLLREANGRTNTFVQAFLNGLASGTKGTSRTLLDVDDPRLILRNDMEKRRRHGSRLRAVDQMGAVLLAWNMIVDPDSNGRRFTWSEGTDIPSITVCRDTGRNASALPGKLRGEAAPQ